VSLKRFLGPPWDRFALFYFTIKKKYFRKPMVWHANYMTRQAELGFFQNGIDQVSK
jgi:hypothetical protein